MIQVSSLYLHIPFCKHLCNYCDFYKKRYEAGSNQIEEFHQFLVGGWSKQQELFESVGANFLPLQTLYLGGGTPSLWGLEGASFLKSWLQTHITLAPACEFTMEVDPGTWNAPMLTAWKELGLNRISVGTQALDPDFLKIMDRAHSLEESLALLEYCHKEQWNYSLDFLLGIPYSRQKQRNIEKELKTLLQFNPKHISLYILNARSKYPHIQAMPDDEFIREEYLWVSQFLQQQGFIHYEVSNFAQPGFESIHNQKYWQNQSVAALGPSATGYLAISKHQALRYKWKVTRPEMEKELLSENELALEKTYLSLRTNKGWYPELMSESLSKLFEDWVTKGYGSYVEGRMSLNALGFLMLDSLMDDLFRLNLPLS
jgi:oxygen-independent coproporphyrinogen III oxidase